jgi:hypothetical protein
MLRLVSSKVECGVRRAANAKTVAGVERRYGFARREKL